MKPVRKLPSEVCSLIRSSVVIPTPSQAVVELVLNSIDAGATSIAVRVDLRIFKIQVVDNGHGITSKDLEEIGNRSVTSKCYTLDEFYTNLMYHGYRGESLASLRDMCGLLEIVSCPADSNCTYSKMFIHGKEEKVKISDLKRPTHGTTITITDFMFNMPVRRERMKEAVELEAIRSCIECIALAHPEISLSIRNDVKGRIIMEKHKSSDLLNAFEHLFGHNLARMLAPVNFSTEKFKISGYIGKEAYRHNDLQFIFVNRQPIIKTKLHKLVTALLSKSSIVRANGPWKSKPIPKDVPVEKWLSFSSLEKQKKFGVFVINITCARKEYEMCWDAKKPLIYFKDWEGIIACVSSAIQEFLKLENLIDDDVDHVVTEDETGNYISSIEGNSQSSQNFPLEVIHQKNLQVETLNIQGAIHGICAKRPRENKMKYKTGVCLESDNQKTGTIKEIGRQFWTPDTINSSNDGFQSEQESVPPVVQFLKKYETPPAARLQITQGAYRLKQKEEQKKKRMIGEKLGTFEFSRKPKLTSFKNCQNVGNGKLTCEKSVEKFKKHFLEPKTKEHKYTKVLYSKVSGSFVGESSDALSLKIGEKDKLCSNSDQINVHVPQKEIQVVVDNESSENISNYFSLSPESNGGPKSSTPLCSSSDVFSFTTEQVSSYEKEDSNEIILCTDSKRSLSHSSGDDVQVNDNFYQSFVKSVNASKYSINHINTHERHGKAFSKNEIFVLKHGCWSSSPFDVKDTHKVKKDVSLSPKNAKTCATLGISKTVVVSIPTPQSRDIPEHTAISSELVNKSQSSNQCSLKNQAIFGDKYENHDYSCKSPTLVNICTTSCPNDDHKSDIIDEFFANHTDNVSTNRRNSREQNSSMFISSSLENSNVIKSLKAAECSRNISDFKIMHVPNFDYENRTKYGWSMHGLNVQDKDIKQTDVSSLKKVKNFRNIFETFEKHIASNITESRSPYFTFKSKTKSINIKEAEKSCYLDLGNINKNYSDGNCRENSKGEEDSDGLLSVFNVPDTSQHRELFPDVNKGIENANKAINVSPIDTFLFSEFSAERNSKTCTKELENATCIDNSKASSPTRVADSEFSVLTLCNESSENFSNSIDVPKRRRLSQNKSEIISDDKEILFSCVKKTEEVLKGDEPFNSCAPSECENMNVGGQTVSILPIKEQCQKETGNFVDKCTKKDWLQVRNLAGKLFYFHTPSGFTTYHVPSITKDASVYSMSKRSQFLPKGMSPLLTTSTALNSTSEQHSDPNVSADVSYMIRSSSNNDDLNTVKWRNKPDIFNNDISDVLSIAEVLPDKKTLSSNTSIPDLSIVTSKMCTLLLKQKIGKKIFSNIQVVGQLDNKFIVTLCSEDKKSNPHILGIFDQHAVHERVRLETLMKAYSSNEDEWSFTATNLDEPLVLVMSSKEFYIMSSFQNKFQKLGLYFSLIDKDKVKIHKIPTCLYTRFLREQSSQWLEGILHILIQDIVLFLIKTGGQDLVVPEVYKDVINSEACKGAIKFGDILSVVECESLLSELSKCDLPFYCAHGRPSFMPLFDLREFEEERRKHIQRN